MASNNTGGQMDHPKFGAWRLNPASAKPAKIPLTMALGPSRINWFVLLGNLPLGFAVGSWTYKMGYIPRKSIGFLFGVKSPTDLITCDPNFMWHTSIYLRISFHHPSKNDGYLCWSSSQPMVLADGEGPQKIDLHFRANFFAGTTDFQNRR